MNPLSDRDDQAGRRTTPQPWHAADEQPAAQQDAERSTPRDMPPGADAPDPLAEPRANIGEILGHKP